MKTETIIEPKQDAQVRRGKYGEIIKGSPYYVAAISAILKELEKGDGDEHGAWETGAAFDEKGRGTAVNTDIYGYARVAGQTLGVVQVREFNRQYRNGWGNVRKNYFLVGRNEGTKRAFAHPIPSRTVHSAIRRCDHDPKAVVDAARAWIWQIPLAKLPLVIRHGDVALIPVRAIPAGERIVETAALASVSVVDAHVLTAQEAVRIDDRLYARDPLLTHQKQQHTPVAGSGWFRVQIGLRADYWTFAEPTAD